MKLISWLGSVILFSVCVIFAVNNRQDVTVDLWPFNGVLIAPLYALVLGIFLTGFLLGAFCFWLPNLRHRFDKKRLNKRMDGLQARLAEEKAKQTPPTL